MATQKPHTTTEALQKLASAEYKRAHAKVLSRLNDPIGAPFASGRMPAVGGDGPGGPRHAAATPSGTRGRGSHPHSVSGPGRRPR